MVAAEIFVGVALVIAAAVAFWMALPRSGHVRSFLRNEQVQAYYAVAGFGVVNIVRGMIGATG
jgi:hypothetical protein